MTRLIGLLVLSFVWFAVPAAAQQRDFRACDAKSDHETRMRVCTAAINSGLFRGKQASVNHNNRGWGFNERGEFDKALADLNEAVRLDPQSTFALVNRGIAYNGKRDFERAIADFTGALRINPKFVEAFSGRGLAYGLKGEHDRGLADLAEAARLRPNNAEIIGTRGWLFNEKRDYDSSLVELNEAIRINPKAALLYNYRGNAFYGKKDLDRSLADFNEAIRLDSKVAIYYQSRGAILHEKRDHDRAIADFSEAMRVDPKNMLNFHLRGRAYREKREFDRAIADFSEANRLDPKHALPLFGRGLTHEAKGDLSAAYRDVVEGLALDPKNAEGQQIRERLRSALTGPAPTAAAPVSPKADAPPVAIASAPPVVPQAAPQPSIAAIAGPRVALVIGNGRYQHATTLPNPANDAADISASLRGLGFDVVEGRDLDKRGMEEKVRQFSRKLDNAKLALFFYAGHGMQVGGRNYLVPVDARLERQGDLSFETIDVSQVLAQMEAEQRVNLVFLDACRDNPLSRSFARVLGARSTSVGQGLATIQSAVGTMIAYATQPDAVALDGTGRNSPFTTALLKHINTRGLEIGSMMRRVRAEVVQTTNGKQVPWDHSSLLGDIILVQ